MLSVDGLLLLSLPESAEATSSDFDDLESDSGKITDGVSRSTETGNEDLVVLVNEGHTTIPWDEGGDSLVVLFQLHSHALSDGRVRLLGFDSNLLDHDACGVGGLLERLLPLGAGVLLLVSQVSPPRRNVRRSPVLTSCFFCAL